MKDNEKPGVIRGEVDGQKKYCRIPVRSKFYEQIEAYGEINAEYILNLPQEQAANVIDALVADWMYWLKRANELYIMNKRFEGRGKNPQMKDAPEGA